MYTRNEMLGMVRPESTRLHMDRKRRAKQFAPFQALKGFEYATKEKEIIYEGRRLQTDGVRIGLDQKISGIGCREIRVTYYMESSNKPGFGTYLEISGRPKLLTELRIMRIGGMEIPFNDIVEIELAEE